MKVHLDTDFGGDIDDLAALALLLNWPDVEITGITTVADEDGRRAGYARYVLGLAGRGEIPVAAGADVASGSFRWRPTYPPEDAFWPEPVVPAPGPLDAALELLRQSIDAGAIVIGIGPYTNLALLDRRSPGILRQTDLYLVGGFIYPPRPTRSHWGNDVDYNVQMDIDAAQHLLTHARPTLVPLHVTVETTLRHAQIPRLASANPVSALIARQALAFEAAGEITAIDRDRCVDIPADFINHLYDPLGCAVALGWSGAVIEELPLALTVEDGWLHERVSDTGTPTRVVSRANGAAFDALWLDLVCT
ncbi:MAG TPA: nucleoside hydrolase [Thermomicrobiales bacterium]|nr:nucleoside hydrolase [Thermomicrobiales bacterium]